MSVSNPGSGVLYFLERCDLSQRVISKVCGSAGYYKGAPDVSYVSLRTKLLCESGRGICYVQPRTSIYHNDLIEQIYFRSAEHASRKRRGLEQIT
jgi:hypothetical protein